MLKIIVVGPTPPFRGGISHHNTNLLSALSSNECDVLSISFSRLYPKLLYPGENDKDNSQKSLENSEPIIDTLNPISWIKCYQRINQFKPDIVIFHWWTTYFAFFYFTIMKLMRKDKYQKICIVHNLFPHEKNLIDPFLTKFALNNFNNYIFHSKNVEEKFILILPNKLHHYFPHPLYKNFRKKNIGKREAKQLLGFSESDILLLMFGLIRPYKGLSCLLEAMHSIIQQNHNYRLIVAGEFWDSIKKYHTQISKLGLDDYITIHNKYIPDDEVPIYFSAADIFTAPYVSGTQSGALKIALSYKLPIVASSVISEEKKKDDENWLVVPPNDPEALSLAIQKIQLTNEINIEDYASWSDFASFIMEI